MKKLNLFGLIFATLLAFVAQAQEVQESAPSDAAPKLMWDGRDSAASDNSMNQGALKELAPAEISISQNENNLTQMQKISDRQRHVEAFLNTTSVPVQQGQISAAAMRTHQFKE
jgi:hypothetical protein